MNRIWQIATSAAATTAFAACSGGGTTATTPSPAEEPGSPPPSTINAVHGRYVGSVAIAGASYFADAIFTPDGSARIYFGGLGGGASGVIPDVAPDTAAQFVGNLQLNGDTATGAGHVIGEGCALDGARPYCDQALAGTIRFEEVAAGYSRDLSGSIQVTTGAGVETWSLELSPWDNVYPFAPDLAYIAGQYQEAIAEFATDGDTIMTVDSDGRIFFQSPGSGCVGNGIATPDPDFNLLSIELAIENCNAKHAYLVGEYRGLATFSTSNYWSYDSVLRAWISRDEASPAPAAVTMWSLPLYDETR